MARFIFLFSRLKAEGINNLPQEGPVIIAANHVSFWDPVLIGIIVNRPIHFIAKQELFNYKILGKLLTGLNAFPVKRGSPDRKAIRHALQILQQGQVLGIFPEGTRNRDNIDLKAASGIALFALKSGAPVVPTACLGSRRILPWVGPRPFAVRMGEAIHYTQQYQRTDSETL
jgi:1-acyl-sn-glycerol-3-phosphate acyltransferase